MPIDHACTCGKKLRLKDEMAGKKFRCPACSAVNQAAPPAPPPAPADDWLSAELFNQPAPTPAMQMPTVPASPAPAMARRPKKKKWAFNFDSTLSMIIGVVLLVAAPVAAIFAYSTYCKAKASADWPSIDGTITHSSVEMKRRKARVYYEPQIEYHYKVGGQEYTGTRLSFVLREFDTSEEAAQATSNKYPLNSTQKVFYDPADPASCTLVPGTTSTGSLLIALVPLVLLAVGGRMVWSALQAAKV
jgi:hypothetical protein